MRDKYRIIEEPCEVKVSRTVLETNGVGNNLVEFNYAEGMKQLKTTDFGLAYLPIEQTELPLVCGQCSFFLMINAH